jgi:hypothetical protein
MDIRGGEIAHWLVCGWFTPDYRPLAERFAANLDQHGAPYHLWAKPRSERGWNTWRKPSVALETMDAYPGKTVVLMDVDCVVRGDIEPLTRIATDVSFLIQSRRARLFWPPHKRIVIKAGSRIVIFRPTASARAFAAEWSRRCETTHYNGDEVALAAAFLARPEISYTALERDALIGHDSAHDRRQALTIKGLLKAAEQRFRTGRTKAAKQAGLNA